MLLQTDFGYPFLGGKINGSVLDTLTRGYFGFAGNLLTGSLPAFLSSNDVPDTSKPLIDLQVHPALTQDGKQNSDA